MKWANLKCLRLEWAELFVERLGCFLDETLHFGGMAGPGVVDGEIPADEGGSWAVVDFPGIPDVDEVEFRAQHSRFFALQKSEKFSAPRGEDLRNANEPGRGGRQGFQGGGHAEGDTGEAEGNRSLKKTNGRRRRILPSHGATAGCPGLRIRNIFPLTKIEILF